MLFSFHLLSDVVPGNPSNFRFPANTPDVKDKCDEWKGHLVGCNTSNLYLFFLTIIFYLLGLKQLVEVEIYEKSNIQVKFDKLKLDYKEQVDINVNLKGKIEVVEKLFRLKSVQLVIFNVLLIFSILKDLMIYYNIFNLVD